MYVPTIVIVPNHVLGHDPFCVLNLLACLYFDITTVRLNVEENQLVDVFGEIGTRIEGLKGA